MKRATLVLVGLIFAVSTSAASPAREDESWLIGAWKLTHDEDGGDSDVIEFRAGGDFISWGSKVPCVPRQVKFHVHASDVYVTVEIPRKGPVASVFRPNADRTKLTYTSQETLNNATYERIDRNPCTAG